MIFGLFKKDNPRAGRDPAQAQTDDFRYRAIPRRSVLANAVDVYPRERASVKALPLAVIRDRYGEQLHAALDNLPLSDEEIDRYVIPVVQRFIQQVHLIPASEMHHHWSGGGLLVHSLEVARYAVEMSESEAFSADTQERIYENRPRWACACCILGLIHDVGKCHDVTVASDDGDVWNCLEEPVMAWFERLNLAEYRVSWRRDRVSKAHESRSLRMAYLRLIPQETVGFLSEVTGPEILDAIDAAVVGREGKLTHILKQAEAQSIAADAEQRREDSIAQADPSKFFSRAVVQAVQGLLGTGRWKPNGRDSLVFYDGQHWFVEAAARAGLDIRESALGQGNRFVPQSIDAQIEMLESSGALVPGEGGELRWVLESVQGNRLAETKTCVCFDSGFVSSLSWGESADLGWARGQKEPAKKVSFVAHGALFGSKGEIARQGTNDDGTGENSQLREFPEPLPGKSLTPHESQELVKRVVLQVEKELAGDGGRFIRKVIIGSKGERLGSSLAVEDYLKRFGLDVVTLKTLIRANAFLFKVAFDSVGHRFVAPTNCDLKRNSDRGD